jgi:hypothetical protein
MDRIIARLAAGFQACCMVAPTCGAGPGGKNFEGSVVVWREKPLASTRWEWIAQGDETLLDISLNSRARRRAYPAPGSDFLVAVEPE